MDGILKLGNDNQVKSALRDKMKIGEKLESKEDLYRYYGMLPYRDPEAIGKFVKGSLKVRVENDLLGMIKKLGEKQDEVAIYKRGSADAVDIFHIVVDWLKASGVDDANFVFAFPVIDGEISLTSPYIYLFYDFDEGRTARLLVSGSVGSSLIYGTVYSGKKIELLSNKYSSDTLFEEIVASTTLREFEENGFPKGVAGKVSEIKKKYKK